MPSNMFGLPSEMPFRMSKTDKRRAFKTSTKKIEWNSSAGRAPGDFKSTSKCRNCKARLIWKGGGYDFDHKDNNPSRNVQSNCWVVCKNCHGKHTRFGTRKEKDFYGNTISIKRIKRKPGYKKPPRQKRKNTKRKRSSSNNLLDFPRFKPPRNIFR